MSFDTLVNLNISLSEAPIPLTSFGVPIIFVALSGPQGTAWTAEHGGNLYIELTPATWEASLAAIGVTDSDPIYTAVATMFSQEAQPDRAYLARRSTAVAQVSTITVPASPTDGTYTVTVNGVTHSYVASGASQTDVANALRTAINGGAAASAVTATGTTSVVITSDEAGVAFTASASMSGGATGLSAAVTTPNVGIRSDVAAVRAQVDDWYHALELTRTAGSAREIAAATAPIRKMSWSQTSDAAAQAAGSSDIGSQLGALGYVRHAVVWHDDDGEYVDAAWVGRMASSRPGNATWHAKTLVGVDGIVPTGESFLHAKRYNFLERFVAARFSMTRNGITIGGQFVDVIIGRDYLHNLIQTRLIELQRDVDKIPMDETGRAMIRGTLRGALLEAAGEGLVDADSINITVPATTALSSANRASRHWSGITFSARLTGAVHSMTINGALAP